MSINTFIVTTVDSCAMVADQLHPEIGSSVPDSVDRIARYFDGLAISAFGFDTVSVELGMTQALANLTFSGVVAGDTVLIGSTLFTGAAVPSGTAQFYAPTSAPTAATDILAAASLNAVVLLNTTTNTLVTAYNVPPQSFTVVTVTDATKLVVSSTWGMVVGEAIVQGSYVATIVSITDATHLVVTSTTSWAGGAAAVGSATVNMVVFTPGVIGNFVPFVASAHAVISGSGSLPANSHLLTASTYAVLAQSAITSTGNTILNGDLGISPAAGSYVTGFPPGIVNGVKHLTDAAAAQAHTDVGAAVTALEVLVTASNTDITSQDLGGYTATPGNYKTRTASTNGTWAAGPLTLNGAGTYIFQFTDSLTLPADASIILANGATADNIYFITANAITFGARNTLYGNFLAGSAITTASLTNLTGRLLTYGASGTAVTMPSAAVVTNPTVIIGLSGGSDGSCLPRVILA